jgi:hypothetical protein
MLVKYIKFFRFMSVNFCLSFLYLPFFYLAFICAFVFSPYAVPSTYFLQFFSRFSSSKASSPYSVIYCFLFQIPVSFLFLYVKEYIFLSALKDPIYFYSLLVSNITQNLRHVYIYTWRQTLCIPT